MLASTEHEEWALKPAQDREYKTEAERVFFTTIENPPQPTEALKELCRDYRRYTA
jgi:hypothetical protein